MNYLKTMRAQFFTTAVLPVLLGCAIAYSQGHFDVGRLVWTTLGIVLINAGTNLTNEYFDHKSGVDASIGFNTPFTGGSRMIEDGAVVPGRVLALALSCFGAGAAVGLYLNAITEGNTILFIGLAGVVSGFFYTAPPFRLGYRGLGEPLILLNLGPLATLGAYYVQVQNFHHFHAVLLLSLIPGLMMFSILLLNEFQDRRGDGDAGKRTLVVKLGKSRSRWLFLLTTSLVYAILIASPFLTDAPVWVYLGLFAAPFMVKALRTLWKHYEKVEELLPANASTVIMHHVLTTLIAIGFVVDRWL